MLAGRAARASIVVGFALLLAVPFGAGLSGASAPRTSTPLASPGAPTLSPVSPAPATSRPIAGPAAVFERDRALLAAKGVPDREIFPPNAAPAVTDSSGVILPTYSAAPAPMGIGDDGVETLLNGTTVGTTSYAQSVEAVVQMNAVNATYVAGDGAQSISMQLNTVLTNVTLFGNDSYQFWIQNVPTYTIQNDEFTIVDNIWNFSSGAFNFTSNSLYSYRGVEVAPVYYYANGPVFHLPMPFTVRLWNNASVVQDRPAVFFNYSVTAANGTVYTGSYDRVLFNSTGLAKPTKPARLPLYQIDGQQYGDNGFLPNDAEITIGGWSDGATQSFTTLNATMQLLTELNTSHGFHSVPSAYNYGFDTGETAEGIGEWAAVGDVAHLNAGPSILRPLWGIAGASFGHEVLDVRASPTNAFLFVAPGARFSDARAAWVPLPPVSGLAAMQIPAGVYSLRLLLSDYRPLTIADLNGSTSVTPKLTPDRKAGVYTPLWAWGNAQLPAISQRGNGTIAAPYVLDTDAGLYAPPAIDPLFGEFNDYLFPVFPGISLSYTTAYVSARAPPSFAIAYTLPEEAHDAALFGVPASNTLSLQTLNTSHVSILDAPELTGWQLADDIGEPLASVLIWNSTSTLIASDQFQDEGTSLFVYGGGDNTIWGNDFTASNAAAPIPSALLFGNDQVGVTFGGSHDLVYNNYFAVPDPAVTLTYDLTTFLSASYHDRWNVTPGPASRVLTVNGHRLSGSIVGGTTQGGNFWANYGDLANPFGVLPYTNGGQITKGGDFDPLLPYALYPVTFTEHGLRTGTRWSLTLNGTTFASTGTSITFSDPNGTYAYAVGRLSGLSATPSSGAVGVNGAARSISVRWT